jgi:YVTN family beta-propeller protein
MAPRLRITIAAALLAVGTIAGIRLAHTAPPRPLSPSIGEHTSILHNGWRLTPVGEQKKTSDMLFGGVLSPDKKLFAVVNAGYNAHHLYLIDSETAEIKQTLPLERAFNGVCWSKDGSTLYASGGGLPQIHVFQRDPEGKYVPGSPVNLPDLAADPPQKDGQKTPAGKGSALVSGLALSKDGATLYAANFATDALYAISTSDGTIKTERKLDSTSHPYCLKLSPDGDELYISQGALGSVAVVNTSTLETVRTVFTDRQPADMAFGPDGSLYVACTGSDTILVLNPKTGQEQERIFTTLTPSSPPGATPQSLSLAPDGKTLYVANSDNNDVAVVDIHERAHSRVLGFIPTGWYPTLVCAAPSGSRILIGSGKGMGAGPNAPTEDERKKGQRNHYVGTLLFGMVTSIPVPSQPELADMSRQVVSNSPYRDDQLLTPRYAPRRGASAIPSHQGDASPIKHILYIIKENRTYDQVLGDMKEGNGDPRICMFGEKITPNIHALAREYVLLDNTYCNGDVSGNGHPWSTGAIGSAFGEREWMQDYGGHAKWVLKDKDIYPPGGRIWDNCEKHGVSFASYYYTWTTDNTHRNMTAEWEKNIGKLRDFEKADLFIKDLNAYERNGKLPGFMIMDMREDHTSGTSPKNFTPQACVASNDLGIGKIVEACSKSKYWKEMAIFIIEDDGQDGPDHVEAHRTEALAISPYTRRHKTVSTFYTTTSLLRSMELILNLPPMTQYDAAAVPMYDAFGSKADITPYTALPAQINVMEKNKPTAIGALESSKMDFSAPDKLTAAQVAQLNRILWHTMKGPNTPYPAPSHRSLQPGVAVRDGDGDDD